MPRRWRMPTATWSSSTTRTSSGPPSGNAHWVWRLHVDSSRPHPPVWAFLRPFLDDYDALVFTMETFAADVPGDRVRLIVPAIDP